MAAMQTNPTAGNVELPGFGAIESERVMAQDELFVVVLDKYPVTAGHTLIVARRQAQRFRDLTTPEKVRLMQWVDWVQQHLAVASPPKTDGFNLGVNDGTAAGHTIPQFQFHFIPRRQGDVEDPRGGVRWVIPAKARYW